MTVQQIYIACEYGSRSERLIDCAERIHNVFYLLSSIDPIFQSWYIRGKSKRKVFEKPTDISVEEIYKRLVARTMKDDHRKIMPGAGSRYDFVSGAYMKDVHWHISGHCNVESLHLHNYCALEAEAWREGTELQVPEGLLEATFALFKTWKPDIFRISTTNCFVSLGRNHPIFSNFNYLRHGYDPVLPENFIVYKEDEGGKYVTYLDAPLML
jgi:hypothetical protein